MNKKEFSHYLMAHAIGYSTFMVKAIAYQNEKNNTRQPAKRWNETQVERAADKMWDEFAENLHAKVEKNIQATPSNPNSWLDFMEKNNFLDELSESISEMEFE